MIILLCLVLVALFLGCDASSLGLHPQSFEPSEYLTAALAHKNAEHLLLNLLCLLPAGALFEHKHGSLALLCFAALAGVLGNLCEVLAAPGYSGTVLGADAGHLDESMRQVERLKSMLQSWNFALVIGSFALTSRFTAVVSLGLLIYLAHEAAVKPDNAIAYFVHLGGYCFGLLWAAVDYLRDSELEA